MSANAWLATDAGRTTNGSVSLVQFYAWPVRGWPSRMRLHNLCKALAVPPLASCQAYALVSQSSAVVAQLEPRN
jgi:hypothetical protein